MKKIDELYLYLHHSISRKANEFGIASRKDVEKFLSKNHHYTKPMPTIILKKMEKFGLIEFMSRDTIRIAKKPIDILAHRNLLFISTKCF